MTKDPSRLSLSVGQFAQLACLLEVSARKAGNVHPHADFEDLRYVDFVLSAVTIAPALDRAAQSGVGQAVLECVQSTRRLVPTNTNLGMVLLLAPLAAVPADRPMRRGISQVLGRLTLDDARLVYEAIRLARPGGLGQVAEQDVAAEPTEDLLSVMRRAADRDMIARQYAVAFADVFEIGVTALESAEARGLGWEERVVACHLEWMARHPDTLIARKRGGAEAAESARRAAEVLAAGWPHSDASRRLFAALDHWLREFGHQRNPGTSADLVAASLFVALREGKMTV